MIPLIVEASMLGLTGFAGGLLITYVLELRRRANFWKKRL